MTTANAFKIPDDLDTRSLFFAELAIKKINEHPNPQLGAVQWSILSDVFEMAIKDERKRFEKAIEEHMTSPLHAERPCCAGEVGRALRKSSGSRGMK